MSSTTESLSSTVGERFAKSQLGQPTDLIAKKVTPSSSSTVLSGILFSRSVRSSFASFTLAPIISPSPSSTTNPSEKENTQQQSPFLVRLQFTDSVQELRSFCRKQFKIGDQIDFLHTENGRWERSSSSETVPMDELSDIANNTQKRPEGSWSQKSRWIVDLSSTSGAKNSIIVRESRAWNMKDCQQYQLQFIPKKKRQQHQQQAADGKKRNNKNSKNDNSTTKDGQPVSDSGDNDDKSRRIDNHHGGAKEKRLQAQELIHFFMKTVGSKVVSSSELRDTETVSLERHEIEQRVRDWFNRGDGVLDVAGGCGHVSMALGMNGIMSTVVDARSTVGKLPGRDRKIWKRSLTNNPRRQRLQQTPEGYAKSLNSFLDYEYCQPIIPAPTVVPFKSQQAWFGSKPAGYDASFRHPDEEDIPLLVATGIPRNDTDYLPRCKDSKQGEINDEPNENFDVQQNEGITSDSSPSSSVLRRKVSALVALHPDEATSEIVQQAVKHRIPFVVVPCCVFARLFPHRKMNDGRVVSSYDDLLKFIQEQDPSIHRTELPFGGKNIALWSVFPDG